MSTGKVILIAFLCIVIGVALAALWFLPSPVKIDVDRNRPGAETPDPVPQVMTRTFTESTDAYMVEAEYPELQGLRNASIQARVNNEIKARVFGRVAAFHAQSAQAPSDIFPEGAFGQSSLAADYDTSIVNGNIFSAIINYSDYSAGAAHPAGYMDVLNYDLRNGQALFLEEVLAELDPAPDALRRLGTHIRRGLLEQLGDDPGSVELVDAGAAPTLENYKHFNVTGAALIVFFEPYQVAPFAAGSVQVRVPYSEFSTSSAPWWLE